MKALALAHQPVMADQVMELMQPRSGGAYVDCTLGAGGHALRMLELSAPDGQLLGVDRDPAALALAARRLEPFSNRCTFVHGRFSDLPRLMEQVGWQQADGVLADLGVSSMQFDQAERGFSFQAGPLDMRMDSSAGPSLAELLDTLSEKELAFALRRFGEVRGAKKLAHRILEAHRGGALKDTSDLAQLVPGLRRPGKTHPATQVFMALRILVNQELDELESILRHLPEPLAVGGRVVFIAFHSLEDRLVKRRLVDLEGPCTCPPGLPTCGCNRKISMRRLTKRAVMPDEDEIRSNQRSRSARLRAAERVAEEISDGR